MLYCLILLLICLLIIPIPLHVLARICLIILTPAIMATLNKHEAASFKICRWCCNKVGKGRVTYLKAGQVRDHYVKYFESIDDADVYRPLVVCVTCKLYLAKASKGSSPSPPPRSLGQLFAALG